MACATISSVSVSAAIKSARISAPASRQHVCILARPASKPAACRLQSNSRLVIARGTYGNNCWNTGDCRPAYNQRQWRSGPNMQRSFEKWAEQATNNMWFPVDVEETAEQYTFVADVPGLGKNDIKVQVNKDRELSISGERQQRSSSSGAASTSSSSSSEVDVKGSEGSDTAQKVQRKRQERRFGTFKRTWNLPEDADVSQIKATVDQGVLSLTINRVQPAEPEVTNIPIS